LYRLRYCDSSDSNNVTKNPELDRGFCLLKEKT